MRTRLLAVLAVAAAAITAPMTPVQAQLAADRPTITVTDFEYGTVAAQIAHDRRTRRQLERMGIRDGQAFAAAMGVGAADLIVEKLLETGGFRVLERKQLAAVTQEQQIGDGAAAVTEGPARVMPARYIVSGSVTRIGFEERHLGGTAGRIASIGLYGLGAKKNTTEVFLTARVIDTETGEIVASFTGEGLSTKGWGLTVFGIGGWGLAGATGGSRNIRESAIGEATERAAQQIADRILQTRAPPALP